MKSVSYLTHLNIVKATEVSIKSTKLLVGNIFKINKTIACFADTNQLIKLKMHGLGECTDPRHWPALSFSRRSLGR